MFLRLWLLLSLTGLPFVLSQDWIDWLLNGVAGIQQSTDPNFADIASQGLGLLNYFSGNFDQQKAAVLTNPQQGNQLTTNLLGIAGVAGIPALPGLPNIPGLQGVPVIPGIAGSFPGVGGCLPSGTPLVQKNSPSLFQNLIGGFPGARDILNSFVKTPFIDPQRLLGKWFWVVLTPSAQPRYCATSEYSGLVTTNASSASFGVVDKYRSGAAHGPTKLGFGYGLNVNGDIFIYTQTDPCPYQIVKVGQSSNTGQYDFLVLSNWAKYPVIGLARDLQSFNKIHYFEMDRFLRKEGYRNFVTDSLGTVAYSDWRYCRPSDVDTDPGNIALDIVNNFLFGGKKR